MIRSSNHPFGWKCRCKTTTYRTITEYLKRLISCCSEIMNTYYVYVLTSYFTTKSLLSWTWFYFQIPFHSALLELLTKLNNCWVHSERARRWSTSRLEDYTRFCDSCLMLAARLGLRTQWDNEASLLWIYSWTLSRMFLV